MQSLRQEVCEMQQKAIERNAAADNYQDKTLSAEEIGILSQVLLKIDNHLPKVQEAIEEAYGEGYLDSTCENETPKRTTANEYFTSKYKSNEEAS